MRLPILPLLTLFAAAAPAADALPELLLNAIESPSLPALGAWEVDGVSARPATQEPRLGAAAVAISGTARIPGAKVDAGLYSGPLADCAELALWIAAPTNVARAGFQVEDAKGEWLMQVQPLTSQDGWQRVAIDPRAGGFVQAYPQGDQDGKPDLPLRSVHLVWFTSAAGPTTLSIDGLTARATPPAGASRVALTAIGGGVAEPGPFTLRFIAENHDTVARQVVVATTVQANPGFIVPLLPEPVIGLDHARGARTTLMIDGKDVGDSKLCDGDDESAYGTAWGSGYKEAVATIDLGAVRQVSALRWLGGDANWRWKLDIAVSTDGTAFTPVAGAQGIDTHGRWGRQDAPWAVPVAAKVLRLRFHHDGQGDNSIRLPATIQVFDGVANDPLVVPQVGPLVARGRGEATVPAGGLAEVVVRGDAPLATGGYLVGSEVQLDGAREVRCSDLFVRPTDAMDQGRARRFGINCAEPAMADELARCGFGWVRFENAKWMMFCPERGKMAFDGSVAPWHVDLDRIFANYRTHGMQVLPYVFQTPEWATSAPAGMEKNRSGYPPRDPADYGEAVFQLVARYGTASVPAERLATADRRSGLGLIDAVELWNEPNLNDPGWGPFVGPLAAYFDVLRAGAEGSRRADPKLPVSSCGFAGMDLAVVGELAEHKYPDGRSPLDLVDIVNVHFYSGREEPEICGWDPNVDRNGPAAGVLTYPQQLEELVAWRDAHKPGAQLWLSETGYDVGGPIGRSERHQAGKLPRCVMLALAAGIDRVAIYRESGSDPSMHAGAGLLRNDRSLRPSWFTVATMIRQLQGRSGGALRLPTADPRVWLLLWDEPQRVGAVGPPLVTAWAREGATPTVPLGVDLGAASAFDAFGRATTVAGTAELPLSELPQYLHLERPSPAFTALVAKARAEAVVHRAERARQAAVPSVLFDFGGDAHVGMLSGHGAPRRFTVVGKDRVWDERLGYGFAKPALGDEDMHWIADPLERDGCRVDPDTVFRFRLPAGRFRLQVSAEASGGAASHIVLTVGGVATEHPIAGADHVITASVAGGGEPLTVSLKGWGVLHWIAAVGE